MMTPKGAQKAITRMSMVRFFPADPETRAVLMEDLGSICESDEQADWLARRLLDLCREWPGLLALWQIYFSKYPPRNERQRALNITCGSTEAFPDGVPSETGRHESERKELSGSAPLQIADPESRRLIADLAEKKAMPATPLVPTLEELDREVRERAAAERAPKPRIFPPVEPGKPITAEQVEEERRKELERRQSAKGAA